MASAGQEQSVVAPAGAAIVTEATPTASLPAAVVSDSATLSGVTATAGGTITFQLFGPSATPACSGTAVFTSTPVPVNGPGAYGPVTTTVSQAGTYWWTAAYSGDANNLAVSSPCGQEQSVVEMASPSIVTHSTFGRASSAPVSDSATLSGVTATAGGTIVFTLFGPSATPACSGTPVFTSSPVPVSGPGTYGPVTATVTVAGTYWWLTVYSGDANNRGVSSTCGDENSLVIQPTIVTVATPTASLPGATLSDRATLSTVTATAGGTIVFTLFGPTPTAACSGTPVFTWRRSRSTDRAPTVR